MINVTATPETAPEPIKCPGTPVLLASVQALPVDEDESAQTYFDRLAIRGSLNNCTGWEA
jgi:hypothetical protein